MPTDPIGFDEYGDPIWPPSVDPRDNPYLPRRPKTLPPGCYGMPPDWRYTSDVVSLVPTTLNGKAEITAEAEGTATIRVRSGLEELPTDWFKFKIKVTKPAKLSPFEKLYTDAFKVDHIDVEPHETHAGTDETVMGVVLECNKKGKCRPASGAVGFEHDNDGDIVVDSVVVSGPFFKLRTGTTSAFDIGRAFTKADRELISLSMEEDARDGRQPGDANGIMSGIDSDDVQWLWLRLGMTSSDDEWDAWMDLVPDGVYDLWDASAAYATSVRNGNGGFDATRLGYDPTIPAAQASGEGILPDVATQLDWVNPSGPDDPYAALKDVPAWKQLAIEDDRITRASMGGSVLPSEE